MTSIGTGVRTSSCVIERQTRVTHIQQGRARSQAARPRSPSQTVVRSAAGPTLSLIRRMFLERDRDGRTHLPRGGRRGTRGKGDDQRRLRAEDRYDPLVHDRPGRNRVSSPFPEIRPARPPVGTSPFRARGGGGSPVLRVMGVVVLPLDLVRVALVALVLPLVLLALFALAIFGATAGPGRVATATPALRACAYIVQ